MTTMLAPVAGMARIGELLEQGYTLPSSWYTDPAIQEREYQTIFNRAWQYAGHLDQLRQPGDFLTTEAGRIPIVVLRDNDGQLRAFINICRHRAHLVVSGCGTKKALQCPYHAWTYRLDGTLAGAPRSDREPGFDKADFGLQPVQVATLGPLVFVNPDPEAGPLAAVLGELPEVVASYVNLDDYGFHCREEDPIDANWKVFIDNAIECYHCPNAHPSFSEYWDVDPDAYRMKTYANFSMHLGLSKELTKQLGEIGPDVHVTGPGTFQFYYIWPNLLLITTDDVVEVVVFKPLDPNHVVMITDYCYHRRLSPEEVARLHQEGQADPTIGEDKRLVESVQHGHRSGALPHGRLLLTSESLLQHFQTLVYRAVSGS
jgi:choline monooxygenase